MDQYDLVSATIGSLFTASDLNFNLARFSDFLSFSGEGLTILKLIMAGFTLLIFVLLVVVVRKLNSLAARRPDLAKAIVPPEAASSGLSARWAEVQRHIASTREAEWKFAVIEADKLADDVLKNSYPGETMGERLMNISKGQLETLDGLWEAHKIRNRLVHDANYFLRYAEAKRAVILYERTLRELHAI